MRNQHHKQKKAARLWANYPNIDEDVFWQNYEALLEDNEDIINEKLYATTNSLTAMFQPPLYSYITRGLVLLLGIGVFASMCVRAFSPDPDLPTDMQTPLLGNIVILTIAFAVVVLAPIFYIIRMTLLKMTQTMMEFTVFFFFKTKIKLEEVEQIQVVETYNNGFRWSHEVIIDTPDRRHRFDYYLNKKQHWSFLEYWKKEGIPASYQGSHYYGWSGDYAKYWLEYNKEYAAAYEAHYGGAETRENM